MNIRLRLGILRSYLMYYGKPFGQRRLKQFYSTFVKEGDLCFDIGSHLGNRSKVFRSLGAKVIAVEPQPACIQFLEKKFKGDAGFILKKIAIGDQQGEMTLHISSLTPTVSTLTDENWRSFLNDKSSQNVKWDQSIKVKVITLDDLIAQYGMPVFCKIDIENFELNALKGLSSPIPVISFEFFKDRSETAIACVSRIEELGNYTFNISAGESKKMVFPKWLNALDLKRKLEIGEVFNAASGDVYARLS